MTRDCATTLQPGQQRLRLKKKTRPGVVAPAYNWEADVGRSPEVTLQVQDQHGQHGETPPLLKTQKLAGCDGASVI